MLVSLIKIYVKFKSLQPLLTNKFLTAFPNPEALTDTMVTARVSFRREQGVTAL